MSKRLPSSIRDNVPDGHEIHPEFQALGPGMAAELQRAFDEELAGQPSRPAPRAEGPDPSASSSTRSAGIAGGRGHG